MTPRGPLGATGEPWDRYARAVVEIVLPDGVLELAPRAEPLPVGPPAGVDVTAPVAGLLVAPVTILTAGDPYPRSLTATENTARDAALVAELDAAGIPHLPALGRSPDGRESEASRALLGTPRATALALAAAHGQLAVFELDAATIACVAVADGAVMTRRAHDVVRRP